MKQLLKIVINYCSIQKKIPSKKESLYQYAPINIDKLLSLVNKQLYFADYKKLNDPFECYFMQRSWINKCLNTMDIPARILALTYENKSNLMYSHYADSHKGLCIEYEINFDELAEYDKISYDEVQYDTKDRAQDLSDLYMLKNKECPYEKEYRLVRFDNQAFMSCEIKSIIFAINCDEGHKKIVYNITKSHKYKNKDIEYYEIKREEERNNFKREKITSFEDLETKDDAELFKLMLRHKFDSLYHYI